MLLLTTSTTTLQFTTGSAGDIEVNWSGIQRVDATDTPIGDVPVNVTTAVTTDIVSGPVGGVTNLKSFSAFNHHATNSNACSVKVTNGTNTALKWRGTLLAGQGVQFDKTGLWRVYGADGKPKQSAVALTPPPLTGSSTIPSLQIAQTWNTSGTPSAIALNVTDTASGAASLLINLLVGGVVQCSVEKSGVLNLLKQIKIGSNTALIDVPSDLGGNLEYSTTAGLYIGNTVDDGAAVIDQVNTTSAGAGLVVRRARGTAAAPLDVANNDQLGYIDYRGYSGTKFWQQASIAAHVDGTFTSGQAPPSRLVFSVNAANGGSTERMRLSNIGLLINTASQISGNTARLTVVQTATDANWTMAIKGATTSGSSYGIKVFAGTTSADYGIIVANAANTLNLLAVKGNGDTQIAGGLSVNGVTNTNGYNVVINAAAGNGLSINNGADASVVANRRVLLFQTSTSGGVISLYDNTGVVSASISGVINAASFVGATGGKFGVGVTGPTAVVHIKAGVATANGAPLKFTSGVNLTTAEAGAMEYNGTNLFFTRAGTVREGVLTQSAVTTEALTSDTSVTVNIDGVTYKLLAKV